MFCLVYLLAGIHSSSVSPRITTIHMYFHISTKTTESMLKQNSSFSTVTITELISSYNLTLIYKCVKLGQYLYFINHHLPWKQSRNVKKWSHMIGMAIVWCKQTATTCSEFPRQGQSSYCSLCNFLCSPIFVTAWRYMSVFDRVTGAARLRVTALAVSSPSKTQAFIELMEIFHDTSYVIFQS